MNASPSVPANAPANAFSVDVEDYFQVAALAPAVPIESWSKHEYRVERNTEVVMGLLDEVGAKATFFVLGWVAERSPALIRKISAAGHEIASHGYSHQLIYTQSPETFRDETRRSKDFLEQTVGQAVIGYRAASFSITKQSLWALDVLVDLGFKYDSSIFPIHHDRYGIPGAPERPGILRAPGGGDLVEFPMAAARIAGMKVPVSGGGYFRLLPYWLSRYGLKQINNHDGRPFTFYIHPWEIDPGQPRIKAGLISRFRHYTGLRGCENRLRKLLREFHFTTMRDALVSAGFPLAG